MRNSLKKATAHILTGIMVFGTLMALPFAAGAEQEYEFYDNFESAGEQLGELPSKWDEDTSGTATFVIMEETPGGNKFARISREAGNQYANPVIATKDNLINMPLWQTDSIVAEARIRTNAFASRKSLRLGYPKGAFEDNGANKHSLFMMRDAVSPAFYYLNGKVTDSFGKEQTVAKKYANKTLEPNTWYDIKAVINPVTRKVTYSFKDDTMSEPILIEGLMDSEEFNNMVSITNITFKWITPAAEIMDVDNVKLYYIFGAPKAELGTDVAGEIPANSQIGISFDKRMDASSLNEDTVRLYSGTDEVVCGERRYDSEAKTYYLRPDEVLTPGNVYRVELSEEIYAANDAENYIAGKLEGTRSFSFTASRTKGTESALSSITVNGRSLNGFERETLNYIANIQYEENMSMPVVEAIPADQNAQVVITYPQGLKGDILIDVIAEDGIVKRQYKVTINVVGEEIANLGKNLVIDSGFESGTLSTWSVYPATWKGFLIENNIVHTGNYAALSSGRTDGTWLYKQLIPVAANKTYLLSGWVRLKDEVNNGTSIEMFPDGSVERPYRGSEMILASADEWKQVIMTIETKKGGVNVCPIVQCWTPNIDYYVDDLYVGELKPLINYTGADEIQIPQPGAQNLTLRLTADVVNQFGTKNGLSKESVSEWRLIGNPYGVSIQGDVLSVASDAESGTLQLEAVVNPTYLGAYTNELVKSVEITLRSNGDTTPKAKQIVLSGKVLPGETLAVNYRYYQSEGVIEGNTEIQWMYSTQKNGSYQPIVGATERTYTVTQEHADHYIRVQIQPKSVDGKTGNATMSADYLLKSVPPTASDVRIVGSAKVGVGDTLTGEYVYEDSNGDEQGETTFRWLRSDEESGDYLPIEGAVAKTYELTEHDADKHIRFAVTPVAKKQPYVGLEVSSDAVFGPARPAVHNVAIKKLSNNLLRGSYEYSHRLGVVEGKSDCKWYVDGVLVSTGTTYEIDFSGSKTVRFEVTPVASKAPFLGESISASFTAGKSSSTSTSHGGGGSFSGIVPVPSPVPLPAQPSASPESSTHWAGEAIAYVMERGIMKNTGENDFSPEWAVTRADVVSYIVLALGIEPVSYKGGFADVSEGDAFAGLLQAAVDHSIISEAELFYPQRYVAREEICKILTTGIYAVQSMQASEKADLARFSDSDQIAEWAVDYVRRAVGMGLMQGVSETEFMPNGQVTRAQTAVLVMRIMKYINKEKAGAENEGV